MLEIERRFRFKNAPPSSDVMGSRYIEQVYTNSNEGSTPVNRIRRTTTEENIYYTHCTKYYYNGECEEVEMDITELQYGRIFNAIGKTPVKKRRVDVLIKQDDRLLNAEIDYYEDGEIIIEVEFRSEEEAEQFIPPEWFGMEIVDRHNFSFEKFSMLNAETIWEEI